MTTHHTTGRPRRDFIQVGVCGLLVATNRSARVSSGEFACIIAAIVAANVARPDAIGSQPLISSDLSAMSHTFRCPVEGERTADRRARRGSRLLSSSASQPDTQLL